MRARAVVRSLSVSGPTLGTIALLAGVVGCGDKPKAAVSAEKPVIAIIRAADWMGSEWSEDALKVGLGEMDLEQGRDYVFKVSSAQGDLAHQFVGQLADTAAQRCQSPAARREIHHHRKDSRGASPSPGSGLLLSTRPRLGSWIQSLRRTGHLRWDEMTCRRFLPI